MKEVLVLHPSRIGTMVAVVVEEGVAVVSLGSRASHLVVDGLHRCKDYVVGIDRL